MDRELNRKCGFTTDNCLTVKGLCRFDKDPVNGPPDMNKLLKCVEPEPPTTPKPDSNNNGDDNNNSDNDDTYFCEVGPKPLSQCFLDACKGKERNRKCAFKTNAGLHYKGFCRLGGLDVKGDLKCEGK